MNATSAANADGSDPSSRQASMIGSGGAAERMTCMRQPESARFRHASGRVWSSSVAPGSARNTHPSGPIRSPWMCVKRPATVWQRSSITARASSYQYGCRECT